MDRTQIYACLQRNLTTVLPDLEPSDITPDRSLADLGCNSIDRAEVVTLTMEDLGIAVPVMEFRDVGDVQALIGLFDKHIR